MPRPNGYQSLHTSVISEDGHPFEVQIRTHDMHRIAEEGIAAHWKYKEGRTGVDKDDHAFSWLRQLLEWQQEVKDPHEFLNSLKLDLYPEEVYCFTPKGEVKMLPRGASPIDFAYAIHTEVGHQCVGARVNGKMVPLRYKLKNGDIVEILTSLRPQAEPRLARLHRHQQGQGQGPPLPQHHREAAGPRDRPQAPRARAAPLRPLAEEGRLRALAPRVARAGARRRLPPRRPLRRPRLRQGLGPPGARAAPPAGEAPGAPGEAAPRRRRGQALPAAQRRADHGEGHGRPPRLPGQVLQPHHGRAHRRLHHAGQGGLRALGELPQRDEPRLRPRPAHRGGVGGGGRGGLRGAPRGGPPGPPGGARRGDRGPRRAARPTFATRRSAPSTTRRPRSRSPSASTTSSTSTRCSSPCAASPG